jgi:hypothetical protein
MIMTHFKKALGGLAIVGMLAAAPAYAISLNFTDPGNSLDTTSLNPFGGFDWISNGSAVATGFVPGPGTVSNVTTQYLASANAVQDPDGNPFPFLGLVPTWNPASFPAIAPFVGDGFEFTVKATILETATCDATCSEASFFATGGTFAVYYDSTPNANRNLGTGYLDGTLIMSGSILPGFAGSFQTTSSSGNFNFKASIDFTETDSTKDAYITPELTSALSGAEIKIGTSTTAWVRPQSFIDAGFDAAKINEPGVLVFQADGNTSVSVPEPGTIALLGLGLLGMAGGAARRRKS